MYAYCTYIPVYKYMHTVCKFGNLFSRVNLGILAKGLVFFPELKIWEFGAHQEYQTTFPSHLFGAS